VSASEVESLADALAHELPEDERDDARTFAAERIAPIALAEAGEDPDRLLLVYERFTERLGSADPAQRFALLRALADEVELEDHNRTALNLAIARYLADGHDPIGASGWITPEIEALREQGDIELQATRRQAALEAWKPRVQKDHPDVWTAYRRLWLHAGTTLASARTGSFATASGSLYEFLQDAGADVQHLDVF
jgi:hypothetical protein